MNADTRTGVPVSSSIFRGAGAGLKIQCLFCANMSAPSWQRKEGQSLSAARGQRRWQQLLSLMEKVPLSSTEPSTGALGTGAGCPWLSFAYR